MLGQVAALGIPMCKPMEFGTCEGGVYSLQIWINGEDAEEIMPLLLETEQYVLGLKSGVTIYTASDAHKQSDVGANIRKLEKMLEG